MILKNKKTRNKKKLGLLILLALFLTAIIAWWFISGPGSNKNQPPVDIGEETINYEPATDEEQQQAEDRKSQIIEEQAEANGNSTTDSKRKVSLTVTGAAVEGDSVGVRAYASNVIENGGTCTYNFTGPSRIVKTSEGVANASTTNCGISIPRSQFSGSGWKVTVSYNSDSVTGVSDTRMVEGL